MCDVKKWIRWSENVNETIKIFLLYISQFFGYFLSVWLKINKPHNSLLSFWQLFNLNWLWIWKIFNRELIFCTFTAIVQSSRGKIRKIKIVGYVWHGISHRWFLVGMHLAACLERVLAQFGWSLVLEILLMSCSCFFYANHEDFDLLVVSRKLT